MVLYNYNKYSSYLCLRSMNAVCPVSYIICKLHNRINMLVAIHTNSFFFFTSSRTYLHLTSLWNAWHHNHWTLVMQSSDLIKCNSLPYFRNESKLWPKWWETTIYWRSSPTRRLLVENTTNDGQKLRCLF